MLANRPPVMRKARATDSIIARFFEQLLSEEDRCQGFADIDAGAASARSRHGMVIEDMPSAMAVHHQPRVWLTGFDRGTRLRIGQTRMADTCSGLDLAQAHPNVTELRDVWST
jgi:hypothetical protein